MIQMMMHVPCVVAPSVSTWFTDEGLLCVNLVHSPMKANAKNILFASMVQLVLYPMFLSLVWKQCHNLHRISRYVVAHTIPHRKHIKYNAYGPKPPAMRHNAYHRHMFRETKHYVKIILFCLCSGCKNHIIHM